MGKQFVKWPLLKGFVLVAFALAGVVFVSAGRADTYSANASAGGYAKTGSFTTSGSFFDVEGSNNGSNTEFGVLDFSASSFGISFPVTGVSSLTLSLTEANASFTVGNGGLNFYISEDTTTTLSSLRFQSSSTPEGLGTQLTPLDLLGSGTFSSNTGNTGSGTVDSYTFSLSSTASAYVASQLSNGGTIRIVITPTTAAALPPGRGSLPVPRRRGPS
ncbi:MAG: hypothetical protein QM796_03755 [Chthoniobacteraceae bacterium]